MNNIEKYCGDPVDGESQQETELFLIHGARYKVKSDYINRQECNQCGKVEF
jgi:hypothetical protein